MITTMSGDTEQAVRDYLKFVHDPDALIDRDKVDVLSRKIETVDDPIERLILRAELETVQHVDRTVIEDRFVAHAKAWADERGITVQALVAEGADERLLRRAGFSRPGAFRRRITTSKDERSRASAETIAAAIPTMGTFTIPQLVARTGGSHGTVRKVIADQVNAGQVKQVGTDSAHSGPGRAPTLYERI